jgi:hypothetical protein
MAFGSDTKAVRLAHIAALFLLARSNPEAVAIRQEPYAASLTTLAETNRLAIPPSG